MTHDYCRWLGDELERLFKCFVLYVLIVIGTVAQATERPLTIHLDAGGTLKGRLHQLDLLRASRRPVVIAGLCMSACTMLLALPQTCVDPEARLTFHGPQNSKRRITPEQHEYYSRLIARHYPPQLERWYLREGRYGKHNLTGSEVIDLGAIRCKK